MNYTHLSKNFGTGNFVHFIPYVNCPELFLKAVLSTLPNAKNGLGIIIDNRSDQSLPSPFELIMDTEAVNYFSITQPCVPLTTAQTMNFMLKSADKLCKEFFTWIHSDGEVTGDSMRLINYVNQMPSNSNWGAVFTRYDVYCAFNVEACKKIGDWDWLRFPYYFLDNDYYHRLKEAGFPCLNIGGEDVIHNNNASNTIKNDSLRNRINQLLFPVQQTLFNEKYPNGTK